MLAFLGDILINLVFLVFSNIMDSYFLNYMRFQFIPWPPYHLNEEWGQLADDQWVRKWKFLFCPSFGWGSIMIIPFLWSFYTPFQKRIVHRNFKSSRYIRHMLTWLLYYFGFQKIIQIRLSILEWLFFKKNSFQNSYPS